MRQILVYDASAPVAIFDKTEATAIITRQLNALWVLDFEYVYNPNNPTNKSEFLVEDMQVRVREEDDATDYSDFKITEVTKTIRPSGAVSVQCKALNIAIVNMSREVVNAFLDFKGETPTNILAAIMGYSSYSAGTCNPTIAVDLTVNYESVLSAIRRLAEACSCYWDFDFANSEVDLLVGANMGADNGVRVEAGHNLKSLSRSLFNGEVLNKIYGVGGGEPPTTIAGAFHSVSSATATVITCAGNKVVPENDFWNTNYQIRFKNGALANSTFTITDCVHGTTNDTITTAGDMSTATARDVFVIETTGGVEVDFVGKDAATFEGVHSNGELQNVSNYVKTPALDGTYAGGGGSDLCADWTKVGSPTIDENTNAAYIKYGQKSQRIQTSSLTEGITQNVNHGVANQTWSIVATVYITSGSVALAIQEDEDTGYVAASDATGWVTLVLENIYVTDSDIDVYLLSATASSDFYVDSVQVTKTVEPQRFANVCEKKQLWNESFDKLQSVADARVTYSCQFADLYRIDPASYPFSEIGLGDTVTIVDDELDINVSVKVVEQRDNVFEPEKLESVISNA